jgi:hypothetical protein
LNNLVGELLHYLLQFFTPAGIGIAVLWRAKAIAERRFLFVLIIVTSAAAVAFAGGDGVASNVFYPVVIADFLACLTAICWLERNHFWLFRAALFATVIAGVIPAQFRVRSDVPAALRMPAATAAARQAITLLLSTKGPAICEDLLLCYAAGKPMDYDPYYVRDQIFVGHLQEADIAALIRLEHYTAIQVNGKLNGAKGVPMLRRFPDGVRQAILDTYRPVLVGPYYLVLVPRFVGAGSVIAP